MARLSTQVKREKQEHALRLFLKKMTLEEISDIIDISVNSLRKWKTEGDWDQTLKIQDITPAQMRMKVLDTMQAMEKGEKPKFKPDDIAKLAKAYDLFSDSKKNMGYMMDNFNSLSDFLLTKVSEQTTKKDKEVLLDFAKQVRGYMDELVNQQRRKLHD